MSRLCILLLIAGCLTRASSSKCLKEKTTPGREILCYTTSYDVRRLDNAICRCTTLVHQGHDLQKLDFTALDTLRKYIKDANSDLRIVVSINDDRGSLGTSPDVLKDVKQELLHILKEVDGVELNVTTSSKESLVGLVKELKEYTIQNKTEKMILLALPTKPENLVKQFDLRELSKYVDLFTVDTHYLTDEEEDYRTFHPSRLMGLFDMLNTDSLVDLISGLGATKRKIIVSIPASAYKFTLQNATDSVPNSPTKEKQPDVLDRKQLCELMSGGEWTLERDEDLTAPYAFKDLTWISFEDTISLGIKGKYIMLRELAGIGIRDAENDLENSCGKSLAQEAHRTFADMKRKPRDALLSSLEKDLQNKETSHNRHVRASDYRISRIIDTKGKIHSIRENHQTAFSCTRQGFFVHPKSCNRFYRCVKFNQHIDDYSVFEFDCPAGLAFDENAQVCVWPGSLSQGSACPGSSEIPPVPKSRFRCPKTPGYYADPENCRWFFACYDLGGSHMIPYEFRCPYGLVFDERKLICEWPWLVPQCKGSGHDHSSGGYDYGHGFGYGNGGQYGHGGGYDNGQYDHGRDYDNGGHYGHGGHGGHGGVYDNGDSYNHGGQYDNNGGYGGDGQYGHGGAYGNGGHYNNGDYGNQGGRYDGTDTYDQEDEYIPEYKTDGGGYGNKDSGSKDNGYGGMDSGYGGMSGGYGGTDSGHGGDHGGYGGMNGGYGGNNDGHGGDDGGYGGNDDGHGGDDGSYGGNDDGHGGDDGGYGGKDDGQSGDDGGYGGNDDKHGGDDGGYGGRDDGHGGDDGGYGGKDEGHGGDDGGYGGKDDGHSGDDGGYGGKDDGHGGDDGGYGGNDDGHGGDDGGYGGKDDGQGGDDGSYGGNDETHGGGDDGYNGKDDGHGGYNGGYGGKDDGHGGDDGGYGGNNDGHGGDDGGFGGNEDTHGGDEGGHGGDAGGYGGNDDGQGGDDGGYGGNDGGHNGDNGMHGEDDSGHGGKSDGQEGSDGDHGNTDGGHSGGDGNIGGQTDDGYGGMYGGADDSNKDDGYGGLEDGYSGQDDGHSGKDDGYGGQDSGNGGDSGYGGDGDAGYGEDDNGKDEGYGGHDGGYGDKDESGHSGNEDGNGSIDGGYGMKDDTHGKDGSHVGSDGEHEKHDGDKDDGHAGKDSGEHDDGKYTVNIPSTEDYDDVKHGSSTTSSYGSSTISYDGHGSSTTRAYNEHSNGYDNKENSDYGGKSDSGYLDQDIYGNVGSSTTPSYGKESSSIGYNHDEGGHSTGGYSTDGYSHSTTSNVYPNQETHDNGYSDQNVHDDKGILSTTASYDKESTGGYDVSHSTGGYSSTGYPEHTTASYGKESGGEGYEVQEGQGGSNTYDNKVTNVGSTGYQPVTSSPTVHIGTGSISSTAGASGYIDQNVQHPSTGYVDQESSTGYSSTSMPYTFPTSTTSPSVDISTGYFDGDSGIYSNLPVNISKPDFPTSNNFAYDVSLGQQSPLLKVGTYENRPLVSGDRPNRVGAGGTYNCNDVPQRAKIRVPTGNYNPSYDSRPSVTGAPPSPTTYRGSYNTGGNAGVRPNFGPPPYAINPTGFNNQYSTGTFQPKAKPESGYKTNEYSDNGGRGTIRFNNGAIATKYAETDIQDYRPYDAPLPASFIPEGNFGNDQGSSRIIVGNQPQSNVAPFNQFTKTGPTRTGIVTAQLGGSGSYIVGSQPRPKPNPDLIGERAFEGNVGYSRGTGPPRPQSQFLNIQILNSPVGSTSQNPMGSNIEMNNVSGQNTRGTSMSPITYITPLQDFKTTVYNAAKMTPSSVTVQPVVDNGYKTMISTERIPTVINNNTKNRINGFYITRAQPILNVGMTLEPPGRTYLPAQTSPKYPTFANSGLKINQNVPNSPIATYHQTFGEEQQVSQSVGAPASNVVMNKVISPVRIYPSSTFGSQPSIVTTSYPNQVFVPSSTRAPSSGGIYNRPFVPAKILAPVVSTNQQYYGEINSNSPSVNLRPPLNSKINCNDQSRVLPNNARGAIKYTPQSFNTPVYNNNFRNKIIQSSTYAPTMTTFAAIPTTRPSTTAPVQVNKAITSTSSVSNAEDKKVIVKLSDLHPLILGKLGAECTCKADPFAMFRGSGRGSLPIESTNKGRVDLANYDESEIYVDLDKPDYTDSINKKVETNRSPFARRPSARYSVSKSISSSNGEASVIGPSSTEGHSSTPNVPTFGSSTYAPPTYTSSPSTYSTVSSTLQPPDMSVRVAGPTSLILNIHDDTSSSQSVSRSRSRSRSGKSLSSEFEKQVHASTNRGSVRSSSSEISGEKEHTVQTSQDCARPGLFRHPKFCNKFYVCHWDEWKKRFTLHVLNCPIHLSFDTSAGACNWPRKGPACQDNNLLV